LKKIPSKSDYRFNKMKSLFFPLLLIITSLLHVPSATNTPKKSISTESNFTDSEPIETIFKLIEGIDNVFDFFGEEMDKKIEISTPSLKIPNQRFLKYDEATFLVNHRDCSDEYSQKYGNSAITFDQMKTNLTNLYDLDKNTILFGLDDLILKEYHYKKRVPTLYLSRTGIIKSNDRYFMIRRNIHTYFMKQHFRIYEIKKEEAYIFWEDSKSNTEAFYINADKDKYFQLQKKREFFMQESVWDNDQTSGYKNYVYTPQQIFEEKIDIEENWDFKTYLEEEQQTTASTTPTNQILDIHGNEFVSSEKLKYNIEKYERELHQFSTLRKVLIPILFDEQEDCKSFKNIFSDEEEVEFSKLYKSILKYSMSNEMTSEDTAEGTDNFEYHCKLFSN